jgi:putative restriction endonuclease
MAFRAWVAVTDRDWWEHLSALPDLDEVNFWQPSSKKAFHAIGPGELFLFKLHSPDNFIVGGGLLARHLRDMPVSLVWESFGEKNGARSRQEMRRRIEKYRRSQPSPFEDYRIGCLLLEEPFFLPRERWIPVPADWSPNIVQGKTYDLEQEPGRTLWHQVEDAVAGLRAAQPRAEAPLVLAAERFGSPQFVMRRLGQGSFRLMVTDAYDRRCAVTAERTLPALEAAHIKPYGEGGEHRVDNGLLLRRDLHALFDRGYLTVTPDLQLKVSRRIREEFENGRDYYALGDRRLREPADPQFRPSADFLRWHNEERFCG